MSQERLIKKYANRRLYDASQSRHITLDDIRALIVKGEKLKVVEDKTGHDITRHILLQVIAEQEQFGRPILSTKVLEAIIRFYGNAMQGFLAGFLEKSVETFLNQQEALQAQISKIVASTPISHRRGHHAAEPRDAREGAGKHARRDSAEARQGPRRGRQDLTAAAPAAGRRVSCRQAPADIARDNSQASMARLRSTPHR